jgi:hypothetical protein
MRGAVRKQVRIGGTHIGGIGVALLTASCMLGMEGNARTAEGQLYTTGNPAYDAFFRDVHQQQVDAGTWSDDKKGAHRALATTLELTADAPDVTLMQATHESASKIAKQSGSVRLVEAEGAAPHVVASGGAGEGGPLFHAVEETARQELDRAKRLRAAEPKLDALAKQESDLEARVKADFGQYGATRANEVASELVATRDVVTKLKARAEAEARESEDFVADVGRALETASEEKAAHAEAHRARSAKKDVPPAAAAPKAATSDPPATPAPPPAQKQSPAPPKPAEPGEVFTP